MSSEADDIEDPPPVDYEGDPLLVSLVRDVNTRETEDGLSITLTVGGAIVSGKLGSRTAYNKRACGTLTKAPSGTALGSGQHSAQMWKLMRRRHQHGLPMCMCGMCGSLMRQERLFREGVIGRPCGGAAVSWKARTS